MRLLLVLLLTAVSALADEARPASTATTAELDPQAVIEPLVAGWNAGDGAAFAAPFTEDADYVVVNGTHLEGRKAIAQGHQAIFDTIYRGTRLTLTVKDVRRIDDDVAVLHSTARVLPPGDSGAEPGPLAIQTHVLVRRDGRWQIAAFHNTRVQDGPPPDHSGS